MLRRAFVRWIGLILLASVIPHSMPASAGTANAGYVDFSFYLPSIAGNNASPDQILAPTAEKPQSKLWYNDGRWWADLFNPAVGAHHIYTLNWATQRWIDTGVALDTRPRTQADILWDGAHLYVVSGGGLVSTGIELDARLYRYSYAARAYHLDPGFPVKVRTGGAESIVIAKDTAGTLWVTYVQNKQVYVNRSLTSEMQWGAPFVLPATGANTSVTADDIAALVASNGMVGVVWSNQSDGTFYYAIHADGASATKWSAGVAARGTNFADDHISLKALQADPAGNLFAVVKTSLNTPNEPNIVVLVGRRQSGGRLSWKRVSVSNGAQGQTRPILLLDTTNRHMYVITADESGGNIYYKVGNLDNPSFDPATKGTLFMSRSSYPFLNNPTSTKQNVTAATDIVVLASYDNLSHPSTSPATSDVYVHNVIPVAANASTNRHIYIPLLRR